MGRAILTNFQARFSVAALKVCCCACVRLPAESGCGLVCGGLAPAQLRAGWCRRPSGTTAGMVQRWLCQLLADPFTHQLIGFANGFERRCQLILMCRRSSWIFLKAVQGNAVSWQRHEVSLPTSPAALYCKMHGNKKMHRDMMSMVQVAMIKNARLAQQLFDGQVYDCICIFEPAPTG